MRCELPSPGILDRVHVTLVGEDPAELDARKRHEPAHEVRHIGRRKAISMEAGVDRDHHVGATAGRGKRPRERARSVSAVNGQAKVRACGELDRAPDLCLAGNGVRHEQLTEAGVDERLRLGQLGDREAVRPAIDLELRVLQRSVRLDVRVERHAGRPGRPSHRVQVGAHPREVDDQRRRVDSGRNVERRAGRRLDGVQIWSSSSVGGRMRPRLSFETSTIVWRWWENITPIATRITKLMMPTVIALI